MMILFAIAIGFGLLPRLVRTATALTALAALHCSAQRRDLFVIELTECEVRRVQIFYILIVSIDNETEGFDGEKNLSV